MNAVLDACPTPLTAPVNAAVGAFPEAKGVAANSGVASGMSGARQVRVLLVDGGSLSAQLVERLRELDGMTVVESDALRQGPRVIDATSLPVALRVESLGHEPDEAWTARMGSKALSLDARRRLHALTQQARRYGTASGRAKQGFNPSRRAPHR